MERVADVTAEWADLAEERMQRLRPSYDAGLVARGIELLRTLPTTASRDVVVHGDVNPDNVLSATRRPWLIIDPKSMIGDPGYDLCPLLLQIDDPLAHADPAAVLRHRVELVAGVVGESADRLLAWSLARCVEAALWHADRSEMDRHRQAEPSPRPRRADRHRPIAPVVEGGVPSLHPYAHSDPRRNAHKDGEGGLCRLTGPGGMGGRCRDSNGPGGRGARTVRAWRRDER